jgi:rhodanese-related sulfurtransferase
MRANKEAMMVASITPRQLSSLLNQASPPIVVDARRNEAFQASPHMVPTSLCRDPDTVDQWIESLKRDRQIVVYCVHGHEVSQGVAAVLAAAGCDVRFLAGGIEDWVAAGLPTIEKHGGAGR